METDSDVRQAVKIIGEALTFSPLEDSELFLQQLANIINEMINRDFAGLVVLLYHLDIEEKKLKSLLGQQQSALSGRIIAELIYRRQLEKIISRRQFRRDNDIEESEKW